MAVCPTPAKRKYFDRTTAQARLDLRRDRGRVGNKKFRECEEQVLEVYRCACGFWHLGHSTPVNVYNEFLSKLEEAVFKRNELLEKLERAKDWLRERWAQRTAIVVAEDNEIIARANEFNAIVRANETELLANMELAKQLGEHDAR